MTDHNYGAASNVISDKGGIGCPRTTAVSYCWRAEHIAGEICQDPAMPDYPPEAWTRLGSIVEARRRKLDFKQDDAKSLSGGRISRATWSDVERGARTNYDRRTLDGVELACRWEEGSIDRVLAGGEPVPLGDGPALVVHSGGGDHVTISLDAELLEEIVALLTDVALHSVDRDRGEQARATLLALQAAVGSLPQSLRRDGPLSPSGS